MDLLLCEALGISRSTLSRLIEPEDSGCDEGQRAATRNVARMRDEKRNGRTRLVSVKSSHDGGGPSWVEKYGNVREDRKERIDMIRAIHVRRKMVMRWLRLDQIRDVSNLTIDGNWWVCEGRFANEGFYREFFGSFSRHYEVCIGRPVRDALNNPL